MYATQGDIFTEVRSAKVNIPPRSYVEAIDQPTVLRIYTIYYDECATDEPFAWKRFPKWRHFRHNLHLLQCLSWLTFLLQHLLLLFLKSYCIYHDNNFTNYSLSILHFPFFSFLLCECHFYSLWLTVSHVKNYAWYLMYVNSVHHSYPQTQLSTQCVHTFSLQHLPTHSVLYQTGLAAWCDKHMKVAYIWY